MELSTSGRHQISRGYEVEERDAERSAGKSAYGTRSLTKYGTGSAAFASVTLALASATSASNALAKNAFRGPEMDSR